MPEERPKTSIVVVVATLGIGLLALTLATGSRDRFEPDSDFRQTPEWGPVRNFVRLPSPRGAQAFVAPPSPTSAPASNDAGDPAREATGRVEALPTEDPYAG